MSKRQDPTPYPLVWPEGRPRAKSRKSGQFQRTEEAAVDEIYRQLELMRAGAITISTNKVNFSRAQNPRDVGDPGAAVWFTYKGQERVLAIDRYFTLRENLCALANTVDALRTVERHGGVEVFDQAMQGFNVQALPAPSAAPTHLPKRAWYEILGVFPTASLELAEAAYRVLAKKLHPDTEGGRTELFQELQDAIAEAREELR